MRHYPFFLFLFTLASCVRQASEQPPVIVVDQQYVHRYGVTIPKHQWEEEGQVGTIVTTREDGVTVTQTFQHGNLEGETRTTFPFSSDVEKIELFSQNELLKETLFYPSGAYKRVKTFNCADHTVTIQSWYENGRVQSFEKLSGGLLVYGEYYSPQGERLTSISEGSGARIVHDTVGIPQLVEEVEAGKVQYRTTLYADGLPKEIDPYLNGVVEGQRKTYYPGGEPKTIETWKGGKQQGITLVFKDGEKLQEIPYVNGMKNGKGKVFKDGAIVIQEPTWKDDQLHGPCILYLDDRKTTEWYFKGRRVTKAYYNSFCFSTPIDNEKS